MSKTTFTLYMVIYVCDFNVAMFKLLEDLYSSIVEVTDVNKSIFIHCHSRNTIKLSMSISLCAKWSKKYTLGCEHRNTTVIVVSYIHHIVPVNADATGEV